MMKVGLVPKALLLAMLFGLATAFDYSDALDKSLLFFEAQRSGNLPYDQRVKWRDDSGLRDGFQQGVDLVGGYYDAGDHVKFGLPMAFSVTMLSWAAVEFNKEITAANQMANTLEAIKWGTDYFLKAHTQINVLWAQVGDGVSDHYCWERAEDMTTPRTAYKVDSSHPGSDVAGETAAALAAASIAFLPYNSSYSYDLLSHAQQLFSFADTYRGEYDNSIQNAADFYPSSGYQDELLWAAAWLYRATNKEYYLKYAAQNGASMGGTGWAAKEFSWDNKYAGLQILLSKILLEGRGGEYTSTLQQYRAKADFFACACLQENSGYNVALTPGGVMYVREWNNLQYVTSAAFLLGVYSEYLGKAKAVIKCPDAVINPQQLLSFAKSQADYILGKNPKSMSYLVGYGSTFPLRVHHRGASIAPISTIPSKIGCVQGFDMWYNRPQVNPNVVYGALVGGPDKYDNFNDERSDYEQTEPTLSGTAPLVGLFAKLSDGNVGSRAPYAQEPSAPVHYTPSFYQHSSKSPATTSVNSAVKFIHSITASWTVKGEAYYRHRVLVKNTSTKPIRYLKLRIEDLSGPVYGLTAYALAKGVYEAPPSVKVLNPGSEFSFVYIQGGPQAKLSVFSYH